MCKDDKNCEFKYENAPHYYYQRSVELEEELKLSQQRLTKLQNENQRNNEIFRNHIEALTNSIKRQEILLLDMEQYKYICNTGVAIVCRFCGEVVLMCGVMQHLIELHFFSQTELDSSYLFTNSTALKNQLESRSSTERIGSKCFEYVIQEKKESELFKVKISFTSSNDLTIDLHEIDNNLNKSIHSNLNEIYKLNLQVIFILFLLYYLHFFRLLKHTQEFQFQKYV